MTGGLQKVFRGLIAAQWLLAIPVSLAPVPPELQEQANHQFATDFRPFLYFLGLVCGLGLLKFVSAVGLYLFKPWARTPYVVLTVLGFFTPFALLPLLPEPGALPPTPLADSTAALVAMIEGAIIALAYASPIADRFRSSGATATQEGDHAG